MLNYSEINSYTMHERGARLWQTLIFFAFAVVGVCLILVFQPYKQNSLSFWWIMLAVILFFVLHEVIHALFILIFSKGRISMRFTLTGIGVGSSVYFSRWQYLTICLAPALLLGLACLLCLIFLPSKFTLLFAIIYTLNFAYASEDFLRANFAMKQPADTYFKDDAIKTSVYEKRFQKAGEE